MTTRPILELRAGLRSRLRTLFEGRGFVEVDTPVLSREVLPEAHIDPFTVPVDGSDDPPHYLQASPEAHMKRHDAEFVLLEWYAPGTSLDDEATFLTDLCATALGTTGLERITCRDAFERHAGIDPFSEKPAVWQAAAARVGLSLPDGLTDSCDAWFEIILSEAVAPRLGHERPTMLEAWPVSQAAFARLGDGLPPTAQRFELFVAGVELANGWEEETRRDVLLERIATANAIRSASGRGALPMPARLVEAHGPAMPAGVGAALGFDRLAMLAAGTHSIDAVRCFTSRTA